VGRLGYLPEFRGKVLDLVASGRKVSEVVFDLEISGQKGVRVRPDVSSLQRVVDVTQLDGLGRSSDHGG
jgi:hypothetical protein